MWPLRCYPWPLMEFVVLWWALTQWGNGENLVVWAVIHPGCGGLSSAKLLGAVSCALINLGWVLGR